VKVVVDMTISPPLKIGRGIIIHMMVVIQIFAQDQAEL
jgi:hypothetical protein